MRQPAHHRPLSSDRAPARRCIGAGVRLPYWVNLDTVLTDDFPRA